MAKRSLISNEEIIQLADRYIDEKCSGNSLNFKITDFAIFVQNNGFPMVNATQIRRKEDLRKYIEKLKADGNHDDEIITATYTTLDVDSFVDKNRSAKSLKSALTQLDGYYHKVADSAGRIFKESKQLKKQNKILSEENEQLKLELSKLIEHKKKSLSSNKELLIERNAYKRIVDTYVYPEIANELLKEQGILKNTPGYIQPEALEENLIKPDTNFNTNIIQGLFNKIDE